MSKELESQPTGLPNKDSTKILVGRQEETARLDNIVKNKGRGVPLVVVRGGAGSGKSSFVHAYPWEEKSWILASGHFAQNRMKEPYSAIIEALNDLIVQWVESDRKQKFSQLGGLEMLLDNDFELLKDVLPASFFQTVGLDFYKEEAPTSSQRSSTFAADAVNAAFRRVISFLCTSKPVALFLKDVHWADHASLDIVKSLVSAGRTVEGLMLIVSHRSDEVKEGHMLIQCLHDIFEQPETVAHTIDILNLNVASVAELIETLLHADPADARCLAEVVHKKTAGNPFFVLQFLHLMRQDQVEWADISMLDTISQVSDNVVDVVAATIKRLPAETQMALKVASCMGKTVRLDVLEHFFAEFPDDEKWDYSIFESVDTIQALGLVKVLDCAVQFGILTGPDEDSKYVWSHDRLHGVAYSMIPKENATSLHTNLGQLLWKRSYYKHTERQTMIFMAADQLTRVADKESNKRLGIVATHIHFGAGKLAMAKSALFPAAESLRAGVNTLKHRSDQWTEYYDLSLELLSCLAEVEVQIGLHEEAMAAVAEIDEHARCLGDKFRSQLVMLKSVTSGNNRDYNLGVEKTLELLKLYGEKLPTRLLPGQLFLENQKLRMKLPGGRLEGLMELPYMSDNRSKRLTTLMTRHLGYYSHLSKSNRHAASLSSLRALNIACKMGVCSDTVMAVVWMAADLKRECHHHESCEYAQLAVNLIKKFPQKLGSLHALVLIMVHAEIFPAIRPYHDSLGPLMECHEVGLKIGNTEPAMGAILGYTFSYLSIGFPLGPLNSDLPSYIIKASQLGLPAPFQILFKIFGQAVVNLTQGSSNPTKLNGQIMNQDEELSRVAGGAATMTRRDINTFRLMLACVYNDWDTAETLLDCLESFLGFEGLISRAHFRMVYIGLAAFVVGRKSGKKKYLRLAKKVLKNFKTERKLGYVNAHPILAMLQAVSSPSKEGYEKAIKVCAGLGLIHHEAFMCERLGLYCIGRDDGNLGRIYLVRAYALYRDWGAVGKLDAMRNEHGGFIEGSSELRSGHPSLSGRGKYSEQESMLLAKLAWQNLVEGGNCDGLTSETTWSRESMTTSSSNSDEP